MSSQTPSSIDPNSGFCSSTYTFHSLRPKLPLPPLSSPLSLTQYAFSLLHSFPPPHNTPAFIDAVTRRQITFPHLILHATTLSSNLRHRFGLQKGDVALILSPNSIEIPLLYFSLLLIGIVIAPSNPASSRQEILHQIKISKPNIAFATSATFHKIPPHIKTTILLDSNQFQFLKTEPQTNNVSSERVFLSDPAAILYSSGTTGRVKGVLLTHQCFVHAVSVGHSTRSERETPAVNLCTVPYFHVYGLSYCMRAAAMGETVVSLGRFEFGAMLKAVEDYRVTHVAAAPPVVVAMAKEEEVVRGGRDLSSLEVVGCGGAALWTSVIQRFKLRFPNVQLVQAYGLTETTARVFGTAGPKESQVIGATGKLISNCEAMIVDPETSKPLPPCTPGEIWVRGPNVMKGYVDDEEATASALSSEGWFKTGDLCYIDNDGFLFFVERLKELIKCKGYQVAPAELEHLLQSHPDIADAAVVPYPDEDAGQVPIAFVIRHKGSNIDELSIKEFVSKQVAPYKRLQRVIFIDSLPKNATGKLLRRELIKLAISSSPVSKL